MQIFLDHLSTVDKSITVDSFISKTSIPSTCVIKLHQNAESLTSLFQKKESCLCSSAFSCLWLSISCFFESIYNLIGTCFGCKGKAIASNPFEKSSEDTVRDLVKKEISDLIQDSQELITYQTSFERLLEPIINICNALDKNHDQYKNEVQEVALFEIKIAGTDLKTLIIYDSSDSQEIRIANRKALLQSSLQLLKAARVNNSNSEINFYAASKASIVRKTGIRVDTFEKEFGVSIQGMNVEDDMNLISSFTVLSEISSSTSLCWTNNAARSVFVKNLEVLGIKRSVEEIFNNKGELRSLSPTEASKNVQKLLF